MFVLFIMLSLRKTDVTHESIVAVAQKEADSALSSFYNESTLLCFSSSDTNVEHLAIMFTVIVGSLGLLLILMTSAFVFSVKRLKAIRVSKLSRSLYISAIVQTLMLITNMFLPMTIFGFVYSLKVENSADFASFLPFFSSFHGIVDTLSMLYFVVPYRKYCLSLFCRKKAKVASLNQNS
uniref:Serpentine Receptor, class H n=1 Tax=Panagrellus redivivus TaxID=6233 RepID=A0A7E4V1G8_PANRE